MEKYRRVKKSGSNVDKEDKVSGAEDIIRISAKGRTNTYVSYASKLFNEKNLEKFTIKATGTALSTAVTVAEVVKRRFKGLHQITELGAVEINDEWEPIEEGLENVTTTRNISFIEIVLSKKPLDKANKGYQEPLDDAEVKELDPEDVAQKKGGKKGRSSKGSGKKGKSGGKKGKGKKGKSGEGKKGKGKKGKSGGGKKGKGKKGKSSKGKSKGKSGKGGEW